MNVKVASATTEAFGVTEDGEKEQTAAAGKGEHIKLIACPNPPEAATDRPKTAFCPAGILAEVGVTEIPKSTGTAAIAVPVTGTV
jgi:hypothetical protein